MSFTDFSTSWHTHPSIVAVGHKAVQDLFSVDVNVEEKVDGSQFSFGLFPNTDTPVVRTIDGVDYGLKIRSKGAVMHPDAPMKMFEKGAEAVRARVDLLHPGWMYRAEYLAKPKHNALAYDRVPKDNVIIFDICTGHEEYLDYEAKRYECFRIGFECVPLIFTGKVESIDQIRDFLNNTSVLGGQPIEGVVIKPRAYNLYGTDKKVLMAKFVSEAFKEAHAKSWGEANPSGSDILQLIGARYNHKGRWMKAIQHLRDAGKLTDSVQDIGPLIREIPLDIEKEETDEIKEQLFKWAWPHIRRLVTRGFPEWYKEHLLEQSFELDKDLSFCKYCGEVPCKGTTGNCENNPDKPAWVAYGSRAVTE